MFLGTVFANSACEAVNGELHGRGERARGREGRAVHRGERGAPPVTHVPVAPLASQKVPGAGVAFEWARSGWGGAGGMAKEGGVARDGRRGKPPPPDGARCSSHRTVPHRKCKNVLMYHPNRLPLLSVAVRRPRRHIGSSAARERIKEKSRRLSSWRPRRTAPWLTSCKS